VDIVESTLLVAVMVTLGFKGSAAGAVNKPLAVISPKVVFPPRVPFTLHVTVGGKLPVVLTDSCALCVRNSVEPGGDINI
jgi:hypothetical protein